MLGRELYLSVEEVITRKASDSLTWLVRGETDGAFVSIAE